MYSIDLGRKNMVNIDRGATFTDMERLYLN